MGPKPKLTVIGAETADGPRPTGSPLYLESISAGFPSPADDYVTDFLDLQRLVVKNPAATFFLRVSGDSMSGAGINDGDLLVVDRSKPAGQGSVVIASLDGELTVKRLRKRGANLYLAPENPDYAEIDITEREDTMVWGVVTYVVHKL
ncbi:MAG: translesion error-prone DNA polymerase V autoproteolytic subunit [Deltaproteobacteria bacterium]|jgi:DNA polymerase V|nr:translesion error-prone DNA polymerase V autoproteolytic subunit [Deltaproteobacteria bacterium]